MVRSPSFDMNGIKSGVWSKEEDDTLRTFIQKHGHHNWQKLPFLAGLARSGKSCRLRWVNYLQPGLKKGKFTKEEVDLIIRLHDQIGNRWSAIAEKLPGRSDNDIKNQWHAHIKKHHRFVTRAEMGDETNCSKKRDHQEQMVLAQDSSAENTNVDERLEFNDFGVGHNDSFSDSSSCFSQINIAMEEFGDLGLCYNDTPIFSDGGVITYEYELNIDLPPLISEQELSTLGLCHNDTPTFSDSSRITYDHDHIHFPPFEFSEFHNDTPTFSDSSSDGGITYQDYTCFTHLPRFPEEEFSDYGLYQNRTPAFSDSSDGSTLMNHGEDFGFNHLESLWYFGDDDL